MRTVAEVAFPDGREGLFGVRDTSTVHAALVAFALSGMSLREEPVPVIAAASAPDDPPGVRDVVGSIRAARLRELEPDHFADPVSDHLEPIPPAVPVEMAAAEAVETIGNHEIVLVVRGDEVVGVVSRRELADSAAGD